MVKSSGRRDSTDTTKKKARSKSAGCFWPGPTGAASNNREMKQLMLRHAFQIVNSVIFVVGPQNLRSQRAMIGGVRVGSRPDGDGRDSFGYQITASTETQDAVEEEHR